MLSSWAIGPALFVLLNCWPGWPWMCDPLCLSLLNIKIIKSVAFPGPAGRLHIQVRNSPRFSGTISEPITTLFTVIVEPLIRKGWYPSAWLLGTLSNTLRGSRFTQLHTMRVQVHTATHSEGPGSWPFLGFPWLLQAAPFSSTRQIHIPDWKASLVPASVWQPPGLSSQQVKAPSTPLLLFYAESGFCCFHPTFHFTQFSLCGEAGHLTEAESSVNSSWMNKRAQPLQMRSKEEQKEIPWFSQMSHFLI